MHMVQWSRSKQLRIKKTMTKLLITLRTTVITCFSIETNQFSDRVEGENLDNSTGVTITRVSKFKCDVIIMKILVFLCWGIIIKTLNQLKQDFCFTPKLLYAYYSVTLFFSLRLLLSIGSNQESPTVQ